MAFRNPFGGKRVTGAPTAPAPAPTVPVTGPTTGPLPGSGSSGPRVRSAEQSGQVTLVNYSPDELMGHVAHSLDRTNFSSSRTLRLFDNFGQVWAALGPITLCLGTIGEVFLVLWLRQKDQNPLAGLSIVAVALVLEGTFLAASWKAAAIRNRAERRPGGATALDKKKLVRQFTFWFALALGVCVTQVVFIYAQTKTTDIGTAGVWAFAIARAVFTLLADGYTAFAHEEKPTDADQALEEQEQRAKATRRFLEQKTDEVHIFNEGILHLRAATVEAEIKEDKLRTQLEVERLQNREQVETLRTQQQQAGLAIGMVNNIMGALFDPSMSDESREKILSSLTLLARANLEAKKSLPEGGRVTRIDEEV